jgi:hypothetical protein
VWQGSVGTTVQRDATRASSPAIIMCFVAWLGRAAALSAPPSWMASVATTCLWARSAPGTPKKEIIRSSLPLRLALAFCSLVSHTRIVPSQEAVTKAPLSFANHCAVAIADREALTTNRGERAASFGGGSLSGATSYTAACPQNPEQSKLRTKGANDSQVSQRARRKERSHYRLSAASMSAQEIAFGGDQSRWRRESARERVRREASAYRRTRGDAPALLGECRRARRGTNPIHALQQLSASTKFWMEWSGHVACFIAVVLAQTQRGLGPKENGLEKGTAGSAHSSSQFGSACSAAARLE